MNKIPGRSRRIRSKERDIATVVLAILIAIFLLTFGGLILQVALFAIVVYIVYRILQYYI